MFNLIKRIDWLERNAATRGYIEHLEAQIKALQQLIIQAGLVEKYVSPLEKGNPFFRLNDEYYTVKKGK